MSDAGEGLPPAVDDGRIPSSMEIYDKIHGLRSQLDVAATADGETNGGLSSHPSSQSMSVAAATTLISLQAAACPFHTYAHIRMHADTWTHTHTHTHTDAGHSHRNWPEQQTRENICDRRPIRPVTAREGSRGRLLSARRLRPSSSRSTGVILTPRGDPWGAPPVTRLRSAPTHKPVGDLSVRHSSSKHSFGQQKHGFSDLSFSKQSVWDRDGALSPLTVEAMHRKGVLMYEIQPIPPAKPGAVAALRYAFLEQQRQALELEVLEERNKLAALQAQILKRALSSASIQNIYQGTDI